MSTIRQRAAQLARRTRPSFQQNARSYASGGHSSDHGHHHAAPVEEPLGKAIWITLATLGGSIAVYSFSQPGKDGEPNRISKIWNRVPYMQEQWETRNTLRTQLFEQAAHDRHLFFYAPRNTHIELNYPEVFSHGSPMNVPAGHYANVDNVVEHYRQQNLKEVDRQAKKQAAAAAATGEQQ